MCRGHTSENLLTNLFLLRNTKSQRHAQIKLFFCYSLEFVNV